MDLHSNPSLKKIALTSDFGTWSWDTQSDSVYFNKTYMEMLGYAHEQFPFHIATWIDLLHPDDREQILKNQRLILEDPRLGESFEDTFRMRTASGEYRWILRRGFILCRDNSGKALHVCGMHIDSKALERTLEDLSIQHDRMSFALEAANDGLWDWNPQTDEVYFSPRYIAMLGYKQEEFPPILASWVDRIHPDDLKKTVDIQREYIKSPALGDTFDCVYRFLDAKGEYRWILGRGKITKRNSSGCGVRVVGLHTDVTELRNAQEALVKLLQRDSLTQLYSRFYFDSVLNQIGPGDYPLSIVFCDLDGLKIVNDILGHADGDRMLADAASILQQALPPQGLAARLGGDEFAALLRKTAQPEAEEAVRRIQAELDRHNAQTKGLPLFLSIGAVTSEDAPVYRLLSHADKRMLENKKLQKKARRQQLLNRIEELTGQKIDFSDNRLFDPHTET